MAAVAATASVAMSGVVRLLSNNHNLLRGLPSAYYIRQERRYKESDNVHNAQGKARLQQPAGLLRGDRVGSGRGDEGDVPEGVGGSGAAGLAVDEPQLVNGADEGANEAEVDEGDEAGVVL